MQIILWALLIYILYRFTVGFLLPVIRTASSMKRQFREMQQQASAFQSSPNQQETSGETHFSKPATENTERTTSGRKGAKEDYIEFEEIPKGKG